MAQRAPGRLNQKQCPGGAGAEEKEIPMKINIPTSNTGCKHEERSPNRSKSETSPLHVVGDVAAIEGAPWDEDTLQIKTPTDATFS